MWARPYARARPLDNSMRPRQRHLWAETAAAAAAEAARPPPVTLVKSEAAALN